MYSYGPPYMAEQKQDDQHEHTYNSSVRIWDVALKTCQRRWTIGRSGERGSGMSMLAARHDDDDGGIFLTWKVKKNSYLLVFILLYFFFFFKKVKQKQKKTKLFSNHLCTFPPHICTPPILDQFYFSWPAGITFLPHPFFSPAFTMFFPHQKFLCVPPWLLFFFFTCLKCFHLFFSVFLS